jgi:hypothetical protein
MQASSESATSRLVSHELPERGGNCVDGGLIAPTIDKVGEELLDLCDLLGKVLSALGESERDFPLIGGGWDALDEFGFDQAIDETAWAARFADETFSNFDQGQGLRFVKDSEYFGLSRGETQRANLLSEETRAFTLCCQDQVTQFVCSVHQDVLLPTFSVTRH